METAQDSTPAADGTATTPRAVSPPPNEAMGALKSPSLSPQVLRERFPVGMIVWGKLPGYNWWPGTAISYDDTMGGRVPVEDEDTGERVEKNSEPQVWIKWFGENNLSQVGLAV